MCKEKTFVEVRNSAINVLEIGIGFLQEKTSDFESSTYWFQCLSSQLLLMRLSGLIDFEEAENFKKRISDIYS